MASSNTQPYIGEKMTPDSAAILDVDGTLHQDLPLVLSGSQYLFEQTVEDSTGMEVETGITPEYFEDERWESVKDTLGDSSADGYFSPDSLEEMFDAANSYNDPEDDLDYMNAARIITRAWMNGVEGMEREYVEEIAEKHIRKNVEDSVGREVHSLVGFLSADHEVYFVSNNPQEFLEPFADFAFGAPVDPENVYGTIVSTENGRYIDDLDRNMLKLEGKKTAIDDIRRKTPLDESSIAIGDSEADVPLFRSVLEAGGTGVVVSNGSDNLNEVEKLLSEDDVDTQRLFPSENVQHTLQMFRDNSREAVAEER